MRRTQKLWSIRTRGHVSWRTQIPGDPNRKELRFVQQERPYPIAELARRMVKVKVRYEGAADYNEQTLLRGEYKYFSGKPVELRGASIPDMIAVLDCAAYFGFGDTEMTDKVLIELNLYVPHLQPHEALHLLLSLAGLKKMTTPLFEEVATRMASYVGELAIDEVLALLGVCGGELPRKTLLALMDSAAEAVEELDMEAAAQLLQTLGNGNIPADVLGGYHDLIRSLKVIVFDDPAEMPLDALLVAADALDKLRFLDKFSVQRVREVALNRQEELTAESLASLFTVLGDGDLALALSARALFLSTELSPAQLLSVLDVYATAMVDVDQATTTAAAAARQSQGKSATGKKSGDSTAQSSPLTSGAASTTSTSLSVTTGSLLTLRERRSTLHHAASELLDQLGVFLNDATAFFAPGVLINYLRLLEAMQPIAAQFPIFNRLVQELCARCTSQMLYFSHLEVVRFLKAAHGLKGRALDASVGAAIGSLVRLAPGFDSLTAVGVHNEVVSMQGLSRRQQLRVTETLIPSLRRAVSHGHNELLN